MAITASSYLKINNSGCHARKNPKQQYLKLMTSRSVRLPSAKSALMFTTMQPNAQNRPSSAWESFNVRQKLGLFVLGVTHILNLPTVCTKLAQVGGWVQHSDCLTFTAQKMKFSIKDFFSKRDQIRRKLRIWSDLLKKSLMENAIFVCIGYHLTNEISIFAKIFFNFKKKC